MPREGKNVFMRYSTLNKDNLESKGFGLVVRSYDLGHTNRISRYEKLEGYGRMLAITGREYLTPGARHAFYQMLGSRRYKTFLRGAIVAASAVDKIMDKAKDPLSSDNLDKNLSFALPPSTAELTIADLTASTPVEELDLQKYFAVIPNSLLGVAKNFADVFSVPLTGLIKNKVLDMSTISNTTTIELALATAGVGVIDSKTIKALMPDDVPISEGIDLATSRQSAVDNRFNDVRKIKIGNTETTVTMYCAKLKALPWITEYVSANIFTPNEAPLPNPAILAALTDNTVIDLLAVGSDVAQRTCQFIVFGLVDRYPAVLPAKVLISCESSKEVFLATFAEWFPGFIAGDNEAARYIRALLTRIKITGQAADKYAFTTLPQEKRALIFLDNLVSTVQTRVSTIISKHRLEWSRAKLEKVRVTGEQAIALLGKQFPLLRISLITFPSLPLSAQTVILDALGKESNPILVARSKALAVRTWRSLEYAKYSQAKAVAGTDFKPDTYKLIAEGNLEA